MEPEQNEPSGRKRQGSKEADDQSEKMAKRRRPARIQNDASDHMKWSKGKLQDEYLNEHNKCADRERLLEEMKLRHKEVDPKGKGY
ncbi:hypothetical protein AJ80_02134 [Polytolypa hystricis UAMH7299]|uniref:Uncharacterized protein n=1 Tax=Polytolypa hystricis (strain UAMH7299) TaxID=1447883 RepID=A0A2B7YRE1_POLH7|nr:hypothetical protein AJ80_02134 [Polytolypa hystricis UAMH7299]